MTSIFALVFISTVIFLLYRIAMHHIAEANKRTQEKRAQFLKAYKNFLKENEGREFFCYTNRAKFCKFIEQHLIPKLDDSISIIKLNGKVPETEFKAEFISYSLYCVKNIGFPNVMKIVNGEMIDYSLHNQIYNSINNRKHDEVLVMVQNALLKCNNRGDEDE